MDPRTKERSAEDQSMREETRSRVSAMADRARERAGDAAETARAKAEDIAGSQKQRATGQLESISSALRQTSGSLRSNQQETIADYVERAASQIDRLSDYVRTRSVGELFDEAQDFARREPALFLGGAFLLGIAGSRFLKASERHHGMSRRETFEMEEETVFHEPRESFSTPGWE
ncbi:MAG TPA: hypothetical protein VF190_12050 [Rhodothermales bacterium]